MQQTLHLAGLLQTSLEINQILEYFIESARNRVMFDSVHYAFDDLDTELNYGNRKRHSSGDDGNGAVKASRSVPQVH